MGISYERHKLENELRRVEKLLQHIVKLEPFWHFEAETQSAS